MLLSESSAQSVLIGAQMSAYALNYSACLNITYKIILLRPFKMRRYYYVSPYCLANVIFAKRYSTTTGTKANL